MNRPQDLEGLHILLIKTAIGDREAFSELIQKIQDRSFKMIQNVSSDFDKAYIDEIFSQALMSIWNNAPGYRGRVEHNTDSDKVAWAWISRVIKNQAIRTATAITKRSHREIPFEVIHPDHSNGDSFGDRLEESYHPDNRYTRDEFNAPANIEHDQDLLQLYRLLTPQERKVLRLLADGHKPVEIAKLLRLTKARISQIMKDIRDKAQPFFR